MKGKTNKGKGKFRKIKAQILAISQAVWNEAMKVMEELNSGGAQPREGASKLSGVVLPQEVKHWLKLLKRILEQTETVLEGNVHVPDRLVSLFDTGARPIQKGKAFPKTEFGRKVLIQEAEKGVVTDFQMHHDSMPVNQPMWEPALDKHKEIFGHDRREVAADRGFHGPGQEEQLHQRGLTYVSIPIRRHPSGHRRRTEQKAWFR